MEPQQTTNPSPETPSVEVPTIVAPTSAPPPMSAQPITNTIWSKTIKRVNYVFLAVCLGLLLIIDLPILVQNPSLAPFFFAMLMALGLFIGCLLFEIWAGKRLQNTPHSGLDTTIFVLATIRNVIIVLNVIPLIQIIGFLISPLALLFILANAIMITMRLKQKPTLLY